MTSLHCVTGPAAVPSCRGPTVWKSRPDPVPKRTDIRKILLIGSGPIVIGQACEFDYSGTQACKALREEGFEVVLVNSNPATIMTDPEMADRTYVEPLTPEVLERIIAAERPAGAPADARRADRAQPRRRPRRARGARALRGGADRRQARGDPEGRGPRALQGGDAADRPRAPALGLRALDRAGARGRPRGGLPGDHPAVVHARGHRAAPSPGTRTSWRGRSAGASSRAPSARCWSRSRSSGGRSSSWR